MVFWNATAYTDQSDYSVYFNEGDFPPLVTVTRTFIPATTTPGGSTVVTVSVTNHGTEPIYNVTIDDDGFAATYTTTTVTGTTSASTAILTGGSQFNMTYTVTFANEGNYAFNAAEVTYQYGGETFSKSTYVDGYLVTADPIGLLSDMISAGWPYTGVVIGVVGLGAVVNIILMARGAGGKSYQV